MRAEQNDPRELAAAICAQVPMTGGTLTSTMDRTDHRVGLFLRELTRNGVRALPRFSRVARGTPTPPQRPSSLPCGESSSCGHTTIRGRRRTSELTINVIPVQNMAAASTAGSSVMGSFSRALVVVV